MLSLLSCLVVVVVAKVVSWAFPRPTTTNSTSLLPIRPASVLMCFVCSCSCVCVGVLVCFFMSMTRGSSPCHCVIPPPLTFFTASQSRSASCRSFTYPRTLESVQDHDLSSSCSSLLPSTICAQISPVIVNSSASSFFNRRLAHCQKSKKFSLSRWSSYSHRSLVVRIRRSARLRQQFFRSNRTNLPPFFISSNRSTSRSSRCPHPHSPTLYPPALS